AYGTRVLADGKIVVGGSSFYVNGESSTVQASSARYVGDSAPTSLSTEDFRAIPLQEPLATLLANVSAGELLYLRSQPNSQGQVIIDLPGSLDMGGASKTTIPSAGNIVTFS